MFSDLHLARNNYRAHPLFECADVIGKPDLTVFEIFLIFLHIFFFEFFSTTFVCPEQNMLAFVSFVVS